MNLFARLGDKNMNTDVDAASEFVCRMYGQTRTTDVNEARYMKLTEMIGNINNVIQIISLYINIHDS